MSTKKVSYDDEDDYLFASSNRFYKKLLNYSKRNIVLNINVVLLSSKQTRQNSQNKTNCNFYNGLGLT